MMESFQVDVAVIGAGVIGLAIGRALSIQGREVMVLESTKAIGTQTSSRNSEVIHAGIYYPKDSLKARLCVKGKQLLYDYLAAHNIPHRKCGKLIVATNDAQLKELEVIQQKAEANGVNDLRWMSREEAQEMEPALRCSVGLFSPSTGILDTHAYMLALQGDFENAGGQIVFSSEVLSGHVMDGEIELRIQSGEHDSILQAKTVINAAGHGAIPVAKLIDGYPQEILPKQYFAKGNYFALQGKSPFSHLIYPVPEPGGLGVHITVDLDGKARFGPDVEWLEGGQFDYEVDPVRAERFYPEIRKYWPDLPDGALVSDYAGIRPKIAGPGEPAADFMIQSEKDHGVPGLVNLFGIESPGITASLAMVEYTKKVL